MINILIQLLPMILGSALLPIWIIVFLLILRSPNGLLRGTAFVAGMTLTRLVQGILFGYVFAASAAVGTEDTGPSPVVAVLLMMIGILLLITAIKTYRNEPDPDAPPPKWMTMLNGVSAIKLFGLGAILTLVAAKLWVFTLSAIATIKDANLDVGQGIVAFLIYVLGAQSLLLLPLVICAVAPVRSQDLLRRTSSWLERYNRPITIAVSLIFGSLFTWKGISALLS